MLIVGVSAGFALAVSAHLLCSRAPTFAAKLLAHMMLGCLGTQVTPPLPSPAHLHRR